MVNNKLVRALMLSIATVSIAVVLSGCSKGHRDAQVESSSASAELPVYFTLDSWADSVAVYLTFEKDRITMLSTHKKSGETDSLDSAIADGLAEYINKHISLAQYELAHLSDPIGSCRLECEGELLIPRRKGNMSNKDVYALQSHKEAILLENKYGKNPSVKILMETFNKYIQDSDI